MSSVGERIKALRTNLGLSADDLAEKIGKNRATIFRYENGDIESMPLEVLEPIAKALNVHPGVLMGWGEPSAFPNNSPEEIEKALDLYDRYKKAIPPIQNAVENLLKPDQPDS